MKTAGILISTIVLIVVFLITTANITSGIKCKTRSNMNVILMNKIAQAVLTYHQHTGQWPKNLPDLAQNTDNEEWQGPYIKAKYLLDPWGQPYTFQANSKAGLIKICTFGSDRQPSGESHARDVTLWVQDGHMEFQYQWFC